MRIQTRLVTPLTVLLLAVGQVPVQAQDGAVDTPVTHEVVITDAGLSLTDVVAEPGDTITWTNESSVVQTIYATDDAFDSGPIPPGGGFVVAMSVPGVFPYRSTAGAAGTILVGAGGFDAPADDLVADHLADRPYPRMNPADIAEHPGLGLQMHRRWIEVGFVDGTTVGQANAALLAAGSALAGAIPRFGFVLVIAPETADFGGLDAALDVLNADPVVDFAAPIVPDTVTALPAPGPDELPHPTFGGRLSNLAWETLAEEPDGRGDNWHLEVSRFPAAWNVVDALRVADHPVRTVVLDSDFSGHVDLPIAIDVLCALVADGTGCTQRKDDGDHGNHVAGIIAADWDNRDAEGRSIGVSGTNPVADVVGYEALGGELTTSQQWDRLLALVDDGTHEHLRVINQSLGMLISDEDAAEWLARGQVCGPGSNDDNASGGHWCTLATEDKWRQNVESVGRRFARIGWELSLRDIVLVSSASNNGMKFCPDGEPCIVDAAEWASGPNWAAANWGVVGVGPNPIVVVEAIGAIDDGVIVPSRTRAPFSQVDGTISAPGYVISPCAGPDTYCGQGGTSQAAPVVAGLIGYLLALDPTLSIDDIRTILVDSAIADTSDPSGTPESQPSPRIDAFGALVRVPGAIRALTDLNDPSRDGNRRARPEPAGREAFLVDTVRSTTPGMTSQPDGIIDMRDFRRFRDAWLQTCSTTSLIECHPAYLAGLAEPGVVQPAGTGLDGRRDHIKRDLNLDGCIGPVAPCPAEDVWSRFDLNGDGQVSIQSSVHLPVDPDGTPGGPTAMSDLDVLRSVWDGGDGWEATDLESLMVSGDLSVDVSNAVALGAFEGLGTVTVLDGGVPVTSRPLDFSPTLVADDDVTVVTVPAGGDFDVEVELIYPDRTDVVVLDAPSLTPGEDRRVSVCGVDVIVDPTVLPPDGSSTASVTASVTNCHVDMAGATVTFEVLSTADSPPTIASAVATADANGIATTTLTAGTERGHHVVRASFQVPGSDPALELTGIGPIEVTGYRAEILATSHDLSGWEILQGWEANWVTSRDQFELYGPSINDAGTVAFPGLARDKTESFDDPPPIAGGRAVRPDIHVSDGTTNPLDPNTARNLTSDHLVNEQYIAGPVTLGNDGDVAVRLREWEGTGYGSEEWIWLLDGDRILAPTQLVRADGAEELNPNVSLGVPDRGGPGTSTFAIRWRDDSPPGSTTVTRAALSQVQESTDPRLPPPPPTVEVSTDPLSLFFPYLTIAEDNTTVARITTGTGGSGTEDWIVVGPAPLDTAQGIATGAADGWHDVGMPGIADSGDVIIFTGDRGAGPGLWLTVRATNGQFTTPVALEGNGGTNQGPGPDAGSELVAFQNDREIRGMGFDRPVGVLHQELGAEGLADDVVTIAYLATPDGASPDLPAEVGLWTTTIEFRATPDVGTSPVAIDTSPARLVRQVGEAYSGSTVVRIEIWDPIGAGQDDGPGAHRLAYSVQLADNTHHVIRATWTGEVVGTDTTTTSIGVASETTVLGSPMVAASDGDIVLAAEEPEPEGDETPVEEPGDPSDPVDDGANDVANVAMSISNLATDAGTEVVVVNRSRTGAGTPVAATLSFDDGRPDVPLAADGVHRFEAPEGELVLSMSAYVLSVTLAITGSPSPNSPPVADAGGPYEVRAGDPVVLDATGSTDPDEQGLLFTWDLDNDGEFDDQEGGLGILHWPTILNVVCGGSCGPDPYPIAVRATDPYGATDTASSTLTIEISQPDFALGISPTSQFINDGQTTPYLVTVDSTGGFIDPVTLEVAGLPEGWSATFGTTTVAPTATVTPPGSAVLNVTAPSGPDLTEGPVDIVVTGTAGDLVRTTGTVAELVFALVPICSTASLAGTVTDAYTGQPLAGVNVGLSWPVAGSAATTTASDGTYRFDNLPGNATEATLSVVHDGYYREVRFNQLLFCDVETNGDVAMVPQLFAEATGRVFEATRNPDGSLTMTTIPIEGATVMGRGTTDATGRYIVDDVALGTYNAPAQLSYRARRTDYWDSPMVTRWFVAGDTVTQDFGMVRRCSATIHARGIVVDQDGTPQAEMSVSLDGPSFSRQWTATDADGAFDFGPVDAPLGVNNQPQNYTVRTWHPLSWPQGSLDDFAVVEIDTCDRAYEPQLSLQVVRAEEPVAHVADLTGTVTNADTGEPAAGVRVQLGGFTTVETDEQGTYLFEDITHLSTDPGPVTWTVAINIPQANGWWPDYHEIEVTSDQVNVFDFEVEPWKYNTLQGVITDIATGDPVEDASVIVTGSNAPSKGARTDSFGRYFIPDLRLNPGNEPKTYRVQSFRSREVDTDYNVVREGYYAGPDQFVTVSVDSGATADFELLRICYGATIRGVVINAETGDPVGEAFVGTAPGQAEPRSTYTDEFGRFELRDVRPGEFNEPWHVAIQAQKSGFVTAQKTVMVSCNASIYLSFGEPSGGVSAVEGTVTDDMGTPLSDVTVVGEWGVVAETAADGSYLLTDAPLSSDGLPRDWDVTATRGQETQSEVVTVTSAGPTTQDFVFPSNRAPVGHLDVYEAVADVALVVDAPGVLANDTDPDGDTLTVADWTQPDGGSVTFTPDGGFVYTPDATTCGDDPFTYTVSDGALTDEAQVVVTVTCTDPPPPPPDDQPPVADAGGPYGGDEGAPIEVDGSGSVAGDHPVATFAWSSDVGAFDDPTAASTTFTAPDNGVFTISLTVCDETDLCDVATAEVTVANVAPTVNAGPDQAIETDATATINVTFTDPGVLDTHTATIDRDDGNGPVSLGAVTSPFTATATYTTAGTRTVIVCVTDNDNAPGCDQADIQVTDPPPPPPENQPPVVDPGGPYSGVEGTAVSIVGLASDPDGSIASVLWSTTEGTIGDPTVLATTVLLEDDGQAVLTLTACDDDGDCTSQATTVTVDNLPPLVLVGPDRATEPGVGLDVEVTFTDPGVLDTHTATLDDGDGGGPVDLGAVTSPFTVTLTYATSGIRTVVVCVTDNGGASHCDQADIQVTDPPPVNQPPVADPGGPYIVCVGAPIDLDGTASTDPDGTIVSYAWDLDGGDPAHATGPTPTVSYLTAGLRVITLVVTDDDGATGTATTTVDVIENGHGEARSAGYWLRQYRATGGTHIDPALLAAYLDEISERSLVFDDLARVDAVNILDAGTRTSTELEQFDRQLLAVWLNLVNGAFVWYELVDTTGDGVDDTMFGDVLTAAEATRLDPAATTRERERVKDVLERLNLAGGH
jgi:plastocyanin